MKKNILVIGGGGREHAICHGLSRSKRVGKIYCAPGNAGIAGIAECVPIAATDLTAIVDFVNAHPDIYMTVIGPDDPLSMGLSDTLLAAGHRVFGPTKAAAKIESSKAFAKQLMKKYNIPTAEFAVFDDYAAAAVYLKTAKFPLVLKADGLALGKGVLICENLCQAEQGLSDLMLDKKFGTAGSSVVIEEFLHGFEVSVLAFCDGKTVVAMPAARDYKRALDGDKGLNTGGMGNLSPLPDFEPYAQQAMEKVFLPTLQAMEAEGAPFCGVLFFGLMICGGVVKVLEYNARFGDPETQVVLPALTSDLLDIFDAVIDGNLDKTPIQWDGKKRVCVVAASGGYPQEYKKGCIIEFLPQEKDILVFHAGTKQSGGNTVTSGGRVLSVVAAADTFFAARQAAYGAIEKIKFDGMFFRHDICKDID